MKLKKKDQQLPGLVNAFDTEKVKEVIQNSFRRQRKDMVIDTCVISDVRYDPGEKCIVLYQTTMTDRLFGKSWDQLFLGKVLKREALKEDYPKEAFLSEQMGMLFSPFPHDPVLKRLPDIFRSEFMKKRLSYVLPKERWKIKNLSIELLAYIPEMRATFQYEMTVLDKSTEVVAPMKWIAKINEFKHPSRVFSNYWALWQQAAGKIPMPKPIGFLIDPKLTFQEKIEGTRLGALVDHPDIDAMIEKLANSLCTFHHLRIPLASTRSPQQEIKTLNRWSDVLIDLRPDLKIRMEQLRNKIAVEMEERIKIDSLIHADFHHTNVLVDGENVQVIDMDEVAYGDPCLDVGRFLSSLRIPSLRTKGSFEGLLPQRELFIETYLKNSSRDRRDIHLFEAACLFTSAASAFRLQRENWENEVLLLLEESEEAFKKVKSGKPQTFSLKSENSCQLSIEERLAWAKDETYIQTLLTPHLFQDNERMIYSCTLKKVESKRKYHSFTYWISSMKGVEKVKEKVVLYLFHDRARRYVYDYIAFLNKKLQEIESPPFLPQPVAYLTELDAMVFRASSGKSLIPTLFEEDGIELAEKWAVGLAGLHRISVDVEDCNIKTMDKSDAHRKDLKDHELFQKYETIKRTIQVRKAKIKPKTAYLSKLKSPYGIKVFNENVQMTFPLTKKVGHPYSDFGYCAAKLIHIGIQKGEMEATKRFLEVFIKTYSQTVKTDEKNLKYFIAEALVNESCKINGCIDQQLLEQAEGYI